MQITIELTRDELRDNETGAIVRPGNGQVFIEPLEESRRARWRKSQHMPPEARTDPRIAHAPEEIPGYQVRLDVDARKVEIADPLHDDVHGTRVVDIFRDRLGRRVDLERPLMRSNLSEEQVWDWAKWMQRAVASQDAVVTSGAFPAIVERRLKQEREWDRKTNPQTGERHWDELPELCDTYGMTIDDDRAEEIDPSSGDSES